MQFICRILRIELLDVANAGPFFQRATKRQKGCQIDLMIQTKHNTLYVCEIKFSTSEVKSAVVTEMRKKLARLSVPKGCSIRRVLVHVNGVTSAVVQSELFDTIVDFSKFFALAR